MSRTLREEIRIRSERRREAMRELRRRGETLEAIGRRYGVSRQRVHAILAEKYDDVKILP